jgi:hypothetical protein
MNPLFFLIGKTAQNSEKVESCFAMLLKLLLSNEQLMRVENEVNKNFVNCYTKFTSTVGSTV